MSEASRTKDHLIFKGWSFLYKYDTLKFNDIVIGVNLMGVRPETTPNPNAIKFTTDKLIFEGTKSISVMPGEKSEHEILNDLMELEGVDNVFGYQNFITVNKKFDVEWDDLIDEVIKVFEKHGYH